MTTQHPELTIPQLREQVLRRGFLRGLLLIGVELVDCARGIEVALTELAGIDPETLIPTQED